MNYYNKSLITQKEGWKAQESGNMGSNTMANDKKVIINHDHGNVNILLLQKLTEFQFTLKTETSQ